MYSVFHADDPLPDTILGANILTDYTGLALRIADFGAAARLTDTHKFHRSWPAGTPPYMAPEVVRGKVRQFYLKCDVWSLGCVVIEMATTKPPWLLKDSNDRWAILYRVSDEQQPCIQLRKLQSVFCCHFVDW